MKKRVTGMVLAFVVLIGCAPIVTSAETAKYGDLYYSTENDSLVVIRDCDEDATSVVVPSTIDGLPVMGIDYSAFNGCSRLVSIEISDGVTGIDRRSFSSTAYYKDENNWENGVLYIGNHLIEANNDKIDPEYKIRNGTKTIAGYAFYDCSNLTGIQIPDSVTNIGYRGFAGCSRLMRLIIPNSVTYIGRGAFIECSSLKSVEIPDSVTIIGNGTFEGCTSLADIYYNGTKAQWEDIIISSQNEALINANIHFLYEQPKPCFEILNGEVMNISDKGQTVAIIIAEYDNGKLENVTSSIETFEADETKTFNVPQNGKIFVWDSLNKMRPLNK